VARSVHIRGMDRYHYDRTCARAISRFPPEELERLRALIAHHDRRLQSLGGPVSPDAVVDAVLGEVAEDPVFSAALRRAWQLDATQRKRRASEN